MPVCYHFASMCITFHFLSFLYRISCKTRIHISTLMPSMLYVASFLYNGRCMVLGDTIVGMEYLLVPQLAIELPELPPLSFKAKDAVQFRLFITINWVTAVYMLASSYLSMTTMPCTFDLQHLSILCMHSVREFDCKQSALSISDILLFSNEILMDTPLLVF